MKTLTAIAIVAFMLLAGCASQSGAQQNQAPSGSPSGQATQPSGKGFTFSDSSNLTTTNGTTSTTTQTAPPPPPPPANNTTVVTSGSGGQIVDVGGSIPVNSGPSGSGN